MLTAHRVTAPDSTRLIAAVDQLSGELRARVGESLRSIDREPPLERVTTASLPALRQYSAAVRAGDHEGNFEKAIAHLEQAVALDTGFAMAYRTLGMYAVNIGKLDRIFEGYGAAMRRLDRLTDRERHFTLGDYYAAVKPDLPEQPPPTRRSWRITPMIGRHSSISATCIGFAPIVTSRIPVSPRPRRRLVCISGYNNLMLLQITLKTMGSGADHI